MNDKKNFCFALKIKNVDAKNISKLAILNMSIVIINIVIFSKGFLGITLDFSNTIKSSFGYTIILMSTLVFIYGNYTLLIQKTKIDTSKRIESVRDCIDVAEQLYSKHTFKQDIINMINQLKRLEKKKEAIEDIIIQKFVTTEISYIKFHTTVLGGENLLLTNVKSTLNKINAFDQEEYDYITLDKSKPQMSDRLMQAKLNVYNEYITYVQSSLENNEEILVKLDILLLELSKFNSLENSNVLDMPELKELEDLINKTKLYR